MTAQNKSIRATSYQVVNKATKAVVKVFEDAAPAFHYAGRMEFRQPGVELYVNPVFA